MFDLNLITYDRNTINIIIRENKPPLEALVIMIYIDITNTIIPINLAKYDFAQSYINTKIKEIE